MLRRAGNLLPLALRQPIKRLYRRFMPALSEPLMYSVHLFDELSAVAGADAYRGNAP